MKQINFRTRRRLINNLIKVRKRFDLITEIDQVAAMICLK